MMPDQRPIFDGEGKLRADLLPTGPILPVGYMVLNGTGGDPGKDLGYGTWQKMWQGRLPEETKPPVQPIIYAWKRTA